MDLLILCGDQGGHRLYELVTHSYPQLLTQVRSHPHSL